ncbi:MAG TPA: rod shape-determining protein MreD [Egicoccus sp.]|nr:rod shape-determining protein MreD [Egicoccus sp.]HSK23971.1 rod shape-determining protein MreD [Egicoccus sp.]
MILRVLAVGLLLVTAAVLQTALFPFLTLAGYRPDLLLLVTVAIGLRDGPLPGLRVGFAAGVLTDLLVSQSPVGIAALIMAVIGFVVGLARPYLAPESVTAPVIIAFASGVLGTAGYGVLVLLLGEERIAPVMLLQASVAVGLYNTLLAPVALAAVGRLSDRFPLTGPGLLD